MRHSQLSLRASLALFLLHGLSHAGARQDGAALKAIQDRAALRESAVAETVPAVFEGRVLMPDGLPAEGAVVVTSSGGKAVADAQGFFRLAVGIPHDAREMQVTAIQAGGTTGLVASATVPLFHVPAPISAGTLRLEQGASCEPSWLPTFGEAPGIGWDSDEQVDALTVWDDGSGTGPALYVGGDFTTAGSASARHIARWDGHSWSPLDGGMSSDVLALTVYDDGSGDGPALYAGGYFSTAGGIDANCIAKWDGASWSPLSSGMNHGVLALTVHDDGSGRGPALYAGGYFSTAGGIAANHIAKWDGASWSPLGSGTNEGVFALTVHDDGDGSGPTLCVSGNFTIAGGAAASRIAKWNGTSWSSLGGGTNSYVSALMEYDNGSGSGRELYAGGNFTIAGGVAANRIAKWNGTSWSSLGSGLSSYVSALTVYDDGSGAGRALYAGGGFDTAGGVTSNFIARWDGSSWSPLGSGMTLNHVVQAFSVYDDGSGNGPALYAGGSFTAADDMHVHCIARWERSAWSPLGGGLNDDVRAITVYDDGLGGGQALYAGGSFDTGGGMPVDQIARWDGSAWSPLGGGMNSEVLALTVYEDSSGSGPALYAGGGFTIAGSGPANDIAKWDGSSWSPLGIGMDGLVSALTVYDDSSGSGPALYAGGEFNSAGGVPANYIARWDGSSWSPLGSGMESTVFALTVYDDGSGGGPALYAGGYFSTAGGIAANHIARWDGSSWWPLGSGVDGAVLALTAYDDGSGSGPALYAAGFFTTAGGVAANRIARWDGTSWSALDRGTNDSVFALAVHDDGSGPGPALYAGGDFTTAGGVVANRIARWDGTSWSPLDRGTDDIVFALAVHNDGSGNGPALFAGGAFTASPAGDSHIAKWGGCASGDVGTAYCFGDGSGTLCPCSNNGSAGEGCANSTGAGAVLVASGSSSVSADDLTLQATSLLPNQPAMLFAGHNAVNNGDGVTFGDGLRCAGGNVRRLGIEIPDGGGTADWGPGLSQQGMFSPGTTRRFQAWYRDPTASPCLSGFNLSNGYEVVFTR